MKREWPVRMSGEGDDAGIFELWQAVHPSQRFDRDEWMKWWHWAHWEIPGGSVVWLAEDKGKIVGYLRMRLMNLKLGNRIVKAAHTLNAATYPDYERQGINLALNSKMRDYLAQNEVHILYGFPNEKSYPNLIRTGFSDIAPMLSIIGVFNWENTLKTKINNKFLVKCGALGGGVFDRLIFRERKVPQVAGLDVKEVSSFDERINGFWERVSSAYPIVLTRNKDFLNWRYVATPKVSYSKYLAEKGTAISGYLVLRCGHAFDEKAAEICELFAESEETACCLLHKAKEHCWKAGMDYVSWNGIAGEAYFKAFHQMGFFRPPFQRRATRFIVRLSPSDISKEFIMDWRNWLVQEGDTDTI